MTVVASHAGFVSSQVRIPQTIFDALLKECVDARSRAWRIESDICELARDGAVNGRGKCWIAGPASALLNFQNGLGLTIAQAFAGREHEVLPTRAAYIYYEAGDFSFLHHDAATSHITVVAGLTDGLLPLMLYPGLSALSGDDVDSLNAINVSPDSDYTSAVANVFGTRGVSAALPIPKQHAVGIAGRRIPHAHPQQIVQGALCTACYSFLETPRGWSCT
jgi:hypothetical protein